MVGSGAYSVWYLLFSISVPFTNTWFQGTTAPARSPFIQLLSSIFIIIILHSLYYTTEQSLLILPLLLLRLLLLLRQTQQPLGSTIAYYNVHDNDDIALWWWRRAAAIVIEIEFKLCTPFKRKLYFSCPFRQRHRRPANTIWAQNVQSR